MLTVSGWDGIAATGGANDHIFFTSNVSDPNFLNNVIFTGFYGDAPGAAIVQQGGLFELVPIPEPTTIIGGVSLLGLAVVREVRRRRNGLSGDTESGAVSSELAPA